MKKSINIKKNKIGYYNFKKIPHLDKYIEVVIIGVIVLSILAAFAHILKDPKTRAMIVASIKNQLSKLGLNKHVK